MPMTPYSGDVEIITNIGTTPQERGLSTDEFKAKFDEGLKAFVTWFNDTHKTEFDAHLAENVTEFNKRPIMTTGAITYYVRTDGNDSNDGSANDSAHAFLTIGKAISILPQIINHIVTINVAAGTYVEDITFDGFVGKKYIYLNGAASVGDTHIVKSINYERCSVPLFVTGFKASSTTAAAFTNSQGHYVSFDKCKTDVSATSEMGCVCTSGIMLITNSIISNRFYGILATNGSTAYSSNNTGTGNTTGLASRSASTIGKSGTQPGGTTAEVADTGGVIR